MKKFSLSLLAGTIIGLVLSFVLMDYKDMSFKIMDQGSTEYRRVRELDFDFAFNASLLVFGAFIIIFVIWTFVEKKIK
ncbi:hypothetical protein [Paenisporosarcina antarctica]|uniref:Uncharacterized protein n=1 Tax=Paenisporosarcina antarctica TaxID=417367 RepID=A0A4P7A1Q6_9BACL|nr:hypothetical protein [Paenisporosarcina antarctica]QBP42633.1 hypothetical protein E2636_16415 [Paenisporosarcina antarctica]